jgi:gluconate 2-dehydrogenase gamma chain
MLPDDSDGDLSRRAVLAGAVFIAIASLTATAQTTQTALTPDQLGLLEAFVDRLIPSDELGPGAKDAGVANYINRALADWLTAEKGAFIDWLTAIDTYARRAYVAGFAEISTASRDSVITAMEAGKATGFDNASNAFDRIRRLTLEGMFGDPYYGGNKDFIGWDLIGYPGAVLGSNPEMQKIGVKLKPLHTSAYGGGHGH